MENKPNDLSVDLLAESLQSETVAAAPSAGVGVQQTAPVASESQPVAQTAPQPAPAVKDWPDAAPEAQPVAVETTQRYAGSDENHTAKNTSMKKAVPMSNLFIRQLTEEEKDKGYLTIFLGNSRDVIEAKNELLQKWLVLKASEGMLKEGEIQETEMQSAQMNWLDYLKQNHPGVEPEEMEQYCSELYSFMDTIQDGIRVRSRVMNEPGISNVSDRGGRISTDIFAKQPKAKSKKHSLAEQMRRASINANQDVYEFDVLLRNSFVRLTIRRPNLLSLGSLMQAITNQVKGYVRQLHNPSVTLAYIAGIRVLWDYVSKLIVDCTVKDTRDFRDLADSILLTDAEELCIAILNAIYTKGVNLELRCMNPQCNWHDHGLADPSKLIDIRKSIETPEESAIYANLFNGRIKLSREEMEKLQKGNTYGLEDNRIYGDNPTHYFRIAPPTLTQAFETLDMFTETINPRIQELRANTLDPKEFENALSALLTSVSSSEYLHWISEYVALPEAGSDEQPDVYKRPTHDTREFNLGLQNILEDDPSLGNALVRFVYNKSPFLSRTFIGVDHHECPKCKQNSRDHDGRKLGFTPINAFMSFFTLTQLKLVMTAVEADNTRQRALSD